MSRNAASWVPQASLPWFTWFLLFMPGQNGRSKFSLTAGILFFPRKVGFWQNSLVQFLAGKWKQRRSLSYQLLRRKPEACLDLVQGFSSPFIQILLPSSFFTQVSCPSVHPASAVSCPNHFFLSSQEKNFLSLGLGYCSIGILKHLGVLS